MAVIATNTFAAKEVLSQLEFSHGGKIGVSAINTANNERLDYRAQTQFPMCSTFKFILVAAVLHKSISKPELLNKRIHYTQADLVDTYSPLTQKNIEDGMTIAELSQAAILSDNSAANLLIKELGGIKQVNKFLKSLNDNTSRLDRVEPDLNSAIPNDERDTTTAEAMSNNLLKILLGKVLNKENKKN